MATTRILDVAHVAEEGAGIDVEPFAAVDDIAGRHALVGCGDRMRQLPEGDAVRGQARQVGVDADLFPAAADDKTLAGVRQRLEPLVDIQSELAQLHEVELVGAQGHRHHRHVVNALRLDQRRHDALGNGVHMRVKLVVELDQRGLHLLADVEAHGDHGEAFARHGIDVLDAGKLRHQPLQRLGNEVGDLAGRSAGIGDEDVDHGHGNLRVFLARRDQHAEQADQEEGHQQQGRQRQFDEGARGAPGNAQPLMPGAMGGGRFRGGVSHVMRPLVSGRTGNRRISDWARDARRRVLPAAGRTGWRRCRRTPRPAAGRAFPPRRRR